MLTGEVRDSEMDSGDELADEELDDVDDVECNVFVTVEAGDAAELDAEIEDLLADDVDALDLETDSVLACLRGVVGSGLDRLTAVEVFKESTPTKIKAIEAVR